MKKSLLIPGLLIMIPVVIFVVAGTPLVLGFVRQKIEQTIGSNLGVPMKIGSLGGNLFFVLHATDIEAPGLGRVAGLEITYNLFGLLSRHVDIRSLRLEGIELDVDRLVDVLGNLPKKADSSQAGSFPLKIQIERFSISEGGIGLKMGENPLNMVVSARGMLLQDHLIVDNLHIATERSVAVLKGIVPLVEAADLNAVFEIDLAIEDLGVPFLSGELVSTGTVKGKFSSPCIKALTRLDASVMENYVRGVVDATWSVPYLDSLEVHGDLRVTTAVLQRGTNGYDTLDIRSHLERTRVRVEIISRYGSMVANGILGGQISRPDFESRIAGQFDYYGFKPSFEGQMRYSDDILRVRQFRLKSRRISMDLGLRYDQKKRRIKDTELSLHCNDLGVLRSIIDAPEDLFGELWLDVEGSGTVESFDAVARLGLSELRVFDEIINAASLYASMKNNVARLDSGTVESARGLIGLRGYYDLKNEDFSLEILSERLRFDTPEVFGTDTLMLGGTVGLSMGFSGDVHNPRGQGKFVFNDIRYDTLQLGTYALDFVLADTTLRLSLVDEHSSSVLDVEVMLRDDFPFRANMEVKHLELDRFVAPALGYATAELTAQGDLLDLTRTRATLRIDTVELAYDNSRMHNIEPVIVDAEDGVVNLHNSTFLLAGQVLHLQGTLPVDFDTGVMDISGRSSDIQLSEIAYLLPGTPSIAGKMNFDIRIQGTPKLLDIDGNLTLEGAGYSIENVQFDSVSGRFLFKNGLVTFEDLSGKINKGQFKASGFADLSRGRLDTMDIDIKLDRIDYRNKDFGSTIFSADLHANASSDSIRAIGEVIIEEGIYDAPMKLQTFVGLLTKANRPAPQQPEIAKRIYCDIGIAVPDSIVIANNVADLAVRADLQLKGHLARLNAYGTISAIGEGTVKYLGREFTIVNAVIQFDDPYKIDPSIDLTATSIISAADGDYVVSLLLNGTVDTWQLELSSNPSLPQQDIVSLLLIGQRRPGEVGTTVKEIDLKDKAKSYALDVVRYGIEKSGEKYLGLDKLRITGELDDPSSLRIGLEKSITKNFTLLYTTGIETWELHQIGAVYDVTDHISVFTQYDQENLNTSVDLDFHFNIR